MILDAGTIFDRNEAAISAASGTPDSAELFRERYITPIFEASAQEGQAIEASFLVAV